jgi:ADP-ribose pyrophosphatase
MLTPWKKLTSKVVQKNPWWEYRFDTCVMPNGKEGEYHYMHTPGAVCIVAVTSAGKILLNNQYRYLSESESIELPMGGKKEGQTIEEAAQHELEEETSYGAEDFQEVGYFFSCNGIIDEDCHVFVASQLRPVDRSCDASEEFEQIEAFPSELDEMIAVGKIIDGMTITAWTLAKPRVLQIIEEQKCV